MAKTTCTIAFDNNPQKVFFGGQTLSGRVVLTLHKEKTVRGISIKIDGKAYCRWTQGSGDSKKTYIGEEVYLSERTYVVGDKTGELILQPGTYNYTFQCNLPIGLPTSVEGDHGHIRYSATVNLDRPLWPDQEFEEGFTVIKPVNLNEQPTLRCPLEVERRKTFSMCCLLCCFQSEPMFIVGRLPMNGYTPGEMIYLDLKVINKSDQSIIKFWVRIIKNISYRTHANSSRTKEDVITVFETSTDGVLSHAVKDIRVNLLVPSIPPTDYVTSNICKVGYSIKATGIVDGCHSDPDLVLPIVIGTFPFVNANIGFVIDPVSAPLAPYPVVGELSSDQISMSMPNAVHPTYLDYPPTYEQAVSGKADLQGKEFAPYYPVYRRPETNANQPLLPQAIPDTA